MTDVACKFCLPGGHSGHASAIPTSKRFLPATRLKSIRAGSRCYSALTGHHLLPSTVSGPDLQPSCSSRWQHGQEKAHHYSSQEERNLSAKVLPSDEIISFLSRECQRGNSAAPYTAHQIAWRAVGLTDTRILRKGMPLLKSGPTDGAIKNTLA